MFSIRMKDETRRGLRFHASFSLALGTIFVTTLAFGRANDPIQKSQSEPDRPGAAERPESLCAHQ